MKRIKYLLIILLFAEIINAKPITRITGNWGYGNVNNKSVIIQQVQLSPNNISSFFYNTGIFDLDKRTSNTPGFEWPQRLGA
ncbi:hypothetical protein BH10BAC5_BH10BAC5_24260 [soil metagenome]